MRQILYHKNNTSLPITNAIILNYNFMAGLFNLDIRKKTDNEHPFLTKYNCQTDNLRPLT